MKLKRRTKTSLRRELAYLERKLEENYFDAVFQERRTELIKALYGEPTKAERETYIREWIRWKRTMNRLMEAGHEIDHATDEPIFSKSV